MNQASPSSLKTDITLIGGGVAGLWLANRLVKAGYNAILLENRALGSFQTVASQGMIHGGIKYTLSGTLNASSEAIADMPAIWSRCLQGEGDIDLRSTRVLSNDFYMWTNNSVRSRVTAFFASKALRGRIEKLRRQQFPPVFQTAAFNGSVYQLVDKVIDTPSLVQNLHDNISDRVFQVDWSQDSLKCHDGQLSLQLRSGNRQLELSSQRFIFCAGEGNGWLLQQIGANSPRMQLRPLKQVMVKHRHPFKLQAHCIGSDSKPRLTLSSHTTKDGSTIWYLGGELAESGTEKTEQQLIADARKELETLFHWLDWSDAEWATLDINRAEPLQENRLKPDKAFAARADSCENVTVAWPTKLTLAPNLADEVLQQLRADGIQPAAPFDSAWFSGWPKPPVAATPWDEAFCP